MKIHTIASALAALEQDDVAKAKELLTAIIQEPGVETEVHRRLDIARICLLLIWQGYDAQGHSIGRSATCGLLETAINLLGEPSRHFRSGCESKPVASYIREAEDIYRNDLKTEFDFIWRNPIAGMQDSDAWRARLRDEIASGFENRFA